MLIAFLLRPFCVMIISPYRHLLSRRCDPPAGTMGDQQIFLFLASEEASNRVRNLHCFERDNYTPRMEKRNYRRAGQMVQTGASSKSHDYIQLSVPDPMGSILLLLDRDL